MERVLIKELDRALKLVREKMLSYTDEELIQIRNLITAGTHAVTLEVYSREVEALKIKEPELV
jgi:hypothetical protein